MRPWMLFGLTLVGCGVEAPTDPLEAGCGAPYEPFAATNYQNQLLRVDAYEQIGAICDQAVISESDFAAIETLYVETASLQEKVQGRTDDHAYASVVEVGASLDAQIIDAIEAGRTGANSDVQCQIIDKTLQRFFALSVFHEGWKSADPDRTLEEMQVGWDEAFGYLGLSNDGTTTRGVAQTLEKRDAEFGFSTTDLAFNGLLDGRCALEAGDPAGALAALEGVDHALLTGLALSVVHEMEVYGDDPLVKGWEGALYWNAVSDWVQQLDPDAHSEISTEFTKAPDEIDSAVVYDHMVRALDLGL